MRVVCFITHKLELGQLDAIRLIERLGVSPPVSKGRLLQGAHSIM